MSEQPSGAMRLRESHVWHRQTEDHYVEPRWVSQRLFDVERFTGEVIDPACGFGHIVDSARDHHHCAGGRDIVDRGFAGTIVQDFFDSTEAVCNIVCNPPFDQASAFVLKALGLIRYRAAIVFPTARLNAAHTWLRDTPLEKVWLLRPRPSMPPGGVIAQGGRANGGRVDYCWLVFSKGYAGEPTIGWLHRDGD